MTMPFYASVDQLMRDRSELARKGIARGRSVVVLTFAGGVLFVAENRSNSLRKVSEIYDSLGFAAVGRYNEFENLRTAGIRFADVRGYSYDRRDVSGRSLANAYAQILGASFIEQQKPFEVELCVAEVGATPDRDQMFRITYDGSISDEPRFVVMGGTTEPISAALRSSYEPGLEMRDALRIALEALQAQNGTSSSSSAASDRRAPRRRRARGRRPRPCPPSPPHVPPGDRRRPRGPAARGREPPPTSPEDPRRGHRRGRRGLRRRRRRPEGLSARLYGRGISSRDRYTGTGLGAIRKTKRSLSGCTSPSVASPTGGPTDAHRQPRPRVRHVDAAAGEGAGEDRDHEPGAGERHVGAQVADVEHPRVETRAGQRGHAARLVAAVADEEEPEALPPAVELDDERGRLGEHPHEGHGRRRPLAPLLLPVLAQLDHVGVAAEARGVDERDRALLALGGGDVDEPDVDEHRVAVAGGGQRRGRVVDADVAGEVVERALGQDDQRARGGAGPARPGPPPSRRRRPPRSRGWRCRRPSGGRGRPPPRRRSPRPASG